MRAVGLSAVALALAFGASSIPVAAADLVFVSAHTTFPTANPGGADEGTGCFSNSTTRDVRVRLDVRVRFSDGTVQRLTGISDPGVLPPQGAYELNVFFIVPADASLGTATFECDVTAQAKSLREREIQGATFEVVQ